MILHLLCGIPGSGKSTLSGRLQGYIVSTDSIRKYLWNDESVIEHDWLVFRLAETIAAYQLKMKSDVIIDATNLTVRKRSRFIMLAGKNGARVIIHWVDCPLETAIVRNRARQRQVPVKIIAALNSSFQRPQHQEGINVIKVYNKDLVLRKQKIPGYTLMRHRKSAVSAKEVQEI